MMKTDRERKQKLNVLFVCYANRERSILAEYLLRYLLKKECPHVEAKMNIESAGIMPENYLKMAEEQGKPFRLPYFGKYPGRYVTQYLSERGVDAASYRSREMKKEMAYKADLILAVDQVMKNEISTRWPEVSAKLFTFKEFIYGKNSASLDIGEYRQLPTTDEKTGDWFMDEDYAQRYISDVEKCVSDSLIKFVQYIDTITLTVR